MKSERIPPFWVNGYQPFSAGAIGRSTATKIRDGKIVTPNSYFKLMKWMEKEKPEVYKEAMEHILKELGKLKMEE